MVQKLPKRPRTITDFNGSALTTVACGVPQGSVLGPLPFIAFLPLDSLYMPISNLSFVSKLLRRVVASQLHAYPSANGMYEPFKSGYRKGHSAETALLRVQNDILLAMDQRKVVRLLLFDLSAAFDTVGYDILLHCLERCFGISREASAHTWQIENKLSLSMVHWVKRVPQGSVLGPILFTLYMSPLGDIIRRHQRGYHMYADDTQLYISISRLCSGTEAEVLPRIQHCFEDINCWTAHNQLKLNNEKPEENR